jgi:hypothetical protein
MLKLAKDSGRVAAYSQSAVSTGFHVRGFAIATTTGIAMLISTLDVKAQSAPTATRNWRAMNEINSAGPASSAPDDMDAKSVAALIEEMRQMRQTIERLEKRVNQLEAAREAPVSPNSVAADRSPEAPISPIPNQGADATERSSTNLRPREAMDAPNASGLEKDATPQNRQVDDENRATLSFLRETTINLAFDGYYGYNFNRPIGRVNLLRAYDVLSNAFSLNQASVIFEHAPNVDAGRRFGARVDLQFGQATETLQGNPFNEPRPQIYRNVFQAYGTYVLPIGKGLTVDFGKWASSLGIEANYTKDQMNYSRSYWFNFLPFYHMGVRANYKLNDALALNYWVVNGTQQTEPFNGFKDQLFGLVIQPHKTVNLTVNYYLGQEHPDVAPVPNTGGVPLQPGLSFEPIRPAPDGRLHIIDSYITWQPTPRLTMALEGDYVIQRLWRHDAPGRSAAPSHTDGGAVYAHYQLTPRTAVAGRAEYLSDHGGMFSGVTQALKETTLTFEYKLADGFLMRSEWRRDFSNQPYFFTAVSGALKREQNTATLGLTWWWGRKEGAW